MGRWDSTVNCTQLVCPYSRWTCEDEDTHDETKSCIMLNIVSVLRYTVYYTT